MLLEDLDSVWNAFKLSAMSLALEAQKIKPNKIGLVTPLTAFTNHPTVRLGINAIPLPFPGILLRLHHLASLEASGVWITPDCPTHLQFWVLPISFYVTSEFLVQAYDVMDVWTKWHIFNFPYFSFSYQTAVCIHLISSLASYFLSQLLERRDFLHNTAVLLVFFIMAVKLIWNQSRSLFITLFVDKDG